MSFVLLLRHEFLVSKGTEGGDKAQFCDWLRQPEHLKQLREYYPDADDLRIREAAAQWQEPFTRTDRTQYSFDGIASPGGFRFREVINNAPTRRWVSVLFDFATCYQWSLSCNDKQSSVDADQRSLDHERAALQVVLARAGGNLFAKVIEFSDEMMLQRQQSRQPPDDLHAP